MITIGKIFLRVLYGGITFIVANGYALGKAYSMKAFFWLLVLGYVGINLLPCFFDRQLKTRKLRQCGYGCALLEIFCLSTTASLIYGIMGFFGKLSLPSIAEDTSLWVINTIVVVCVEAIVFWNGMIRVYLTSGQMGIKWRVIGAVCGMIPVVNLIVLGKIIAVSHDETQVENKRILLNEARADERLCKTKYPILMVHGVFFRDFRYFNYWGRIPADLEANGATIYYGNHQSAAAVKDSAKELDARIRQIVKETGCEKVNIIAHSKGGLDCRYALSELGTAEYVASLTTINTPHRGCEFADYLLDKIPDAEKQTVAMAYNTALKRLGDPNPDFLAAVHDLTASACEDLNEQIHDAKGVYYQSVGSKLTKAMGGRFPLNLTNKFVEHFDGYNDGLVGEKSFPWGENYQFLTAKGKRGISHGDMIDLNRENFKGFDVREFYVNLVKDLKERGY